MQIGTRYITLAEYLSYGDQPVEVVDGEVIMAAAHARRHSRIIARLTRKLDPFVHKNKLGELLGESSYVLDGDPRSKWVSGARIPDLSFISRERVEAHDTAHPDEDEPWWLAPDLAVEVISPTDRYDDVSQKVADYLRFGVRLVWVIDPAGKSVRVHSPGEPLGHSLGVKDKLTAEPVIDGWSMKVSDLFADD